MNRDLDDLGSQLAGLTNRFVDLGARLGDAARELQGAGAPPPDALVEALGAVRAEFLDLCAVVVADAESLSIAVPSPLESVKSLEPLITAIGAAIEAERRRAAVVQARAEAVDVLDRVLGVRHTDDEAFGPLVNCHQHADALKISALAIEDTDEAQLRAVTEHVRPYVDFLAMLEASEAIDDDRFSSLEESVSKNFGRSLAVAAARGRLLLPGQEPPPPLVREPEPEPVVAAPPPPAVVAPPPPPPPPPPPSPPPPPVAPEVPAAAPTLEEKLEGMPVPTYEPPPEPPRPEPEKRPTEPAPRPAERAPAAAPSVPSAPPDETAQWWLAAWARWSGWKTSMSFADAAKEEISKYPYLLSVPIQEAPDYEDGLLAYGYSVIMEHIEGQSPGCVGNALNNLKSGQGTVGDQLYEYLVAEGRLTETYPDFLKSVLLAVIPEPGLWVQARIIHSKDDTRVFQRPSQRYGETEQSAQRYLADNQRFAEHRFSATLPGLTARCFLVSAELREAHGLDVRVKRGGEASDAAWVVTVPTASKANVKVEARQVGPEGTSIPAIGRDYAAVWVALFNADPKREANYVLSLALRKRR